MYLLYIVLYILQSLYVLYDYKGFHRSKYFKMVQVRMR